MTSRARTSWRRGAPVTDRRSTTSAPGTEISLNEVAEMLLRVMGVVAPARVRAGAQRQSACRGGSPTRGGREQEIGFQAVVPFEDGLRAGWSTGGEAARRESRGARHEQPEAIARSGHAAGRRGRCSARRARARFSGRSRRAG